MTCILIGHKYKTHRLGTVYGATTLDSVATGINACGTFTVNLPASPSTNQIITISNTCTGVITVNGNGQLIGAQSTTTLAAGITGKFYWDGYTWGVWFSDCSASTLNATHDFGTTTQGPSGTPYTVPANTITYENVGYTPCGGLLRKIITTTYAGRNIPSQYMASVTGLARFGGTYFDETNTPDLSGIGNVKGYGSSSVLAYASCYAQYSAFAAASLTGLDALTWNKMSDGPGYTGYYINYSNGSLYRDVYTPAVVVYGGPYTIYYLDTQIVWTYEII